MRSTVVQLRINVNDGAAFAPMNMEQLAAHYQLVELPLKAYSAAEGYRSNLKLHVTPKWGKHSLSTIKSVAVEGWLRNFKTAKGQPASPGTKTKIRNLMSALFSHAIRYSGHRRTQSLPSAPRPNGFAPQTFSLLRSSRHCC
jgi:hypothetical protein